MKKAATAHASDVIKRQHARAFEMGERNMPKSCVAPSRLSNPQFVT